MPVSYGHISYVIAETCDILDSIISHDILLSVTYTVFVSLKTWWFQMCCTKLKTMSDPSDGHWWLEWVQQPSWWRMLQSWIRKSQVGLSWMKMTAANNKLGVLRASSRDWCHGLDAASSHLEPYHTAFWICNALLASVWLALMLFQNSYGLIKQVKVASNHLRF